MQSVNEQVIDRVQPFYAGRSVLVTGGASFISSHLVEALVQTGARVRVADDFSSGRIEHLTDVKDDIEVIPGDLRDPHVAKKACEGMELVFHLAAAHGGRGYIESHPVECLENIGLDHTVFAAAALGGSEKIIHASSACVYPTNLQDDVNGRALLSESAANFETPGAAFADGAYGWAKIMGEYQLAAVSRQFGLSGASCRIFTAYGERENESHAVVGLIAKAVARLDPYPIWGDGLQTRNFTYVADTAAGLLLAGEAVEGFDVVNVGGDVHHTINDLVEAIFDVLDWHPDVIDRQLDKPVGVLSRAADCTKSAEMLGWRPSFSFHEGIARTTHWYESIASSDRLAGLETLLMER